MQLAITFNNLGGGFECRRGDYTVLALGPTAPAALLAGLKALPSETPIDSINGYADARLELPATAGTLAGQMMEAPHAA